MPIVDASVVVDWVVPDADPEGPARRLLTSLAAEDAQLAAPRLHARVAGSRPVMTPEEWLRAAE